jgi:hypothetical protein
VIALVGGVTAAVAAELLELLEELAGVAPGVVAAGPWAVAPAVVPPSLGDR